MGRKLGKKRRRVSLAEGPYVERVHDRKATDLLRNAQVAPLDVDDPYEPGAKITVLRSYRTDPLGRLHAHGQITDAQYHGGRDWQRDWEAAERGPCAIDPTKEFVDGGRLPEPITEAQRKAAIRLQGVAAVLTHPDERRVLYASLVEGLTAEQIGLVHFQRFGRKWAEHYGRKVRHLLEVLAVFYGYAMPAGGACYGIGSLTRAGHFGTK